MFAILIREREYPCGNIFGIFSSFEKATQAMAKIHNTSKHASIEIIEIEVDIIYPASLTDCANCMTDTKIDIYFKI